MGLFWSFLLSMESMEPGQLSITLYSVCKIQNLNTEIPLSVDVGFFLFSFVVLLILFRQSGSCPSSFIYFSSCLFRGFCDGGGLVFPQQIQIDPRQ